MIDFSAFSDELQKIATMGAGLQALKASTGLAQRTAQLGASTARQAGAAKAAVGSINPAAARSRGMMNVHRIVSGAA